MIFKKIEKVVGLRQPAGRNYLLSIEYSSKLLNQVSKVRGNPHTAKIDRGFPQLLTLDLVTYFRMFEG